MNLNQQQRKVIDHSSGPLLIVAGAGTGKTAVIAQKIVELVNTKKCLPENILSLTFTQKAATEMLERLDVVMPLGYEEPWVGTFHGICDRILKSEAIQIGLDSNYRVISTTDQWMLIKKNIFDLNLKKYLPLGNPSKFISALLQFFSKIQDENIEDGDLKEFLKTKKTLAPEEWAQYKELVNAYDQYQQLKVKNSLLDFGDLITWTIKLFKQRPSILRKYKSLFQYVFIDEFQDTNYAQYELIKLLCPNHENPNLIVVGDDDQSIYKFRGASISNILEFKNDYPTAKEVILTQNYRSTQVILDSAYHLIKHNNPDRLEEKLGISKMLKSAIEPKKSSEVVIVELETQHAEVDWVIEKIIELVSEERLTFKDIAILARANSHLDIFIDRLKKAGIPYQQVGGRGLFTQPEISLLLNFLSVIANPEDDSSLFEFLSFPSYKYNPGKILSSIQRAKRQASSLWSIISSDSYYQQVVAQINSYQQDSLVKPVSKILYDFVIDSQYIKLLTSQETVESVLKVKNINLFFDRIKKYEAENKHSNLVNFLEALELWLEAGENPAQATIEDVDTVSLMTVHASKGLEFEAVFIVNMVSGRFPSSARKDAIDFPSELMKEEIKHAQSHTQEERRLMYVAITRAKKYLYCTFTTDYGGVRKRIKSGFLNEMQAKTIVIESKGEISILKNPTPAPITYLTPKGHIRIDEVSYTQIETFKECPLRYKYRYIINIPTLPSHAITFGKSIHTTLYEFHRLAQQGEKLTSKTLLNLFKKNFDEDGYDSQDHKQARFKKTLTDLRKYYDSYQSLFGKPIHLEKAFKLKVGTVVVSGKIDRIDQTENGVEIIDYKTGSPKNQSSVNKDEQLSMYALAAKEALNLKVEKLSLYFLENGQKIETTRSDRDIEKTKQKLVKDIAAIKQSDFRAKPSKVKCSFCAYQKICPFNANK